MISLKLIIAIFAFVLSGGHIVFQTFQQHHVVNPKHGGIRFMVFILSSLSLIYLAKDIYADFESKKTDTSTQIVNNTAEIVYWRKIYRAGSPQGYCDYLEKYPQGQFVNLAKRGIPGEDCLQVKRQTEAELKAALEAELKAKQENDAKALAEKNALLEQEAKENAARIEVLEQAKLEAESKQQAISPSPPTETQIEEELEEKFKVDPNTLLPPKISESDLYSPIEPEKKAASEFSEKIF